MKKIISLAILSINCIFFLSCNGELSASYPPIIPQDTVFLEKNISEAQAVKYGDEIIAKQVPVSRFEGEVYAHDSKLLIYNNIGYCAYYGNDISTHEGVEGQAIRLSIFEIDNPGRRKVIDVFKEDESYNGLILNKKMPCYTPVLFVTGDKKIRILAKVYTGWQQKYFYRDYDPIAGTLSDPKICKLFIKSNLSAPVDFDINNVRSHLNFLFGKDYELSTEAMYATSEPVFRGDYTYIGLTIGRFTANWQTDQGTTILLRTKDFGETFEMLGAPDGRTINKKYSSQFVEAAFDFNESGGLLMLGRNGLGGMMLSYNSDLGNNFSQPISLNETCNFKILASKPNLIQYDDGIITVWNTTENVGTSNVRTTLEIRYGRDSNICNNPVKIKIKNQFGCHYPSIFKYNNAYYLTYTTDSRRFNRNSTGEIVFVKLPF